MTNIIAQENQLWSAIKAPLNSFVGTQQNDGSNENGDDNNLNDENNTIKTETQEEADRKRYRKRYQNLLKEVEEVNDEATNIRKQLWETQDSLKESEDKVRKLENHLNEILELREKDLKTITTLEVSNAECVEMESRARESMEVFKKVYKRAQLQIKEQEEEIAILREQRDMLVREKSNGRDTAVMVDESALEYIKIVSEEKEKRLKDMLFQAEKEVELWKSKHKVAMKRAQNSREQIRVMEEDPTESVTYVNTQRKTIEELENKLRILEEENEMEERDDGGERKVNYRYPATDEYFNHSVVGRAFCDEDLDDGLTRDLIHRLKNLHCSVPSVQSFKI